MFPVVAEDNIDDHKGGEDSKTDPSHPASEVIAGGLIAMLNHGGILSTEGSS